MSTTSHRVAILIGALLLAVIAAGAGYNIGLNQGAAQSGHEHHHYGGYFFGFFFFIFAGILFLRALGGSSYGRCRDRHEMMSEWHRREHDRMQQ